MPEAPDLEVVREVLTERAVGARVSSARVVRPGVLRSLKGEFASDVEGPPPDRGSSAGASSCC